MSAVGEFFLKEEDVLSAGKGLILVFDLDNTIVGEYSDQSKFDSEEIVLNERIVELLRKAVDARNKNIVSAILLLTNNADEIFIKVVELTISMRLKKNYHFTIFDEGMSRNHPFRSPPKENPPKSLREVEYMVRKAKLDTENLANRVIFIDDIATHQIAQEIPKEHYIHVNPPFVKGGVDTTDYTFLEQLLEPKRGGRKVKKTRRRFRSFLHRKRLNTRKQK
jgi:hypothetical protein